MIENSGWIQRKILEGLKGIPYCFLLDMTCYVFNVVKPNKSQYNSVSRAVLNLEEDGLIRCGCFKWRVQTMSFYEMKSENGRSISRRNHPRWSKIIYGIVES